MKTRLRMCAGISAIAISGCAVATTPYGQSYLGARYDWSFRDRFPQADRLFNAFDYGHAVVYQILLTSPQPAARLDREFEFITTRLLRHPPGVPLDESTIGPDYVRLVPEVTEMFEWAHALHRQIYDIWASTDLTNDQRDAAVARAVRYYRSRKDLAFSVRPKSMTLMEGQTYSLAFRRQDRKFNGLLWSYHWLQMALYDALLAGRTERQLQANVDTTVATFFRMVDPGGELPAEMPMSPSSAPHFSARYSDAAIIFDNLHSLHDVVSDILVSPTVPASQKRAAILRAAARYRDDTTAVISTDEWLEMGRMMEHAR